MLLYVALILRFLVFGKARPYKAIANHRFGSIGIVPLLNAPVAVFNPRFINASYIPTTTKYPIYFRLVNFPAILVILTVTELVFISLIDNRKSIASK